MYLQLHERCCSLTSRRPARDSYILHNLGNFFNSLVVRALDLSSTYLDQMLRWDEIPNPKMQHTLKCEMSKISTIMKIAMPDNGGICWHFV
jgi:hypothetical protein